jgi:hypothetical protein
LNDANWRLRRPEATRGGRLSISTVLDIQIIMWETGQKTKHCYFWMSENDVAHFNELLAQMQPALVWESSPPSPRHTELQSFRMLVDALAYSGHPFVKTADTRLALSSARVLIYPQKIATASYKDPYAPDFIYPSDGFIVKHGEMNVRWNTMDGDKQQALMAAQVKAIFSVLTKATLPAKIQALAGYPVRGFRIGAEMLAQVRTNGWFLKSHGPVVRLA